MGDSKLEVSFLWYIMFFFSIFLNMQTCVCVYIYTKHQYLSNGQNGTALTEQKNLSQAADGVWDWVTLKPFKQSGYLAILGKVFWFWSTSPFWTENT